MRFEGEKISTLRNRTIPTRSEEKGMAASGGMLSVQDMDQHSKPARFKGYLSKFLWGQHGSNPYLRFVLRYLHDTNEVVLHLKHEC